ncbi:MAG TPA: hypothetical protein DCE13_06730 [Cryomorphaceae bacterium]|jgi:hypothetical protein|nr:MAG: hypothetical protein ABR98_05470 [Cryomorphaceae bacterium BACL7 MAG-120910-bin2]KRO69084.1 MAG: hypothetical protein ABR88_01610 [Cryomorphaceae bacterium BACL7 MAG-120322-bin74]KRO82948.1 MAG: hypothetical protein ABR87_00980 [Cryomorphaceae bacterium BACL7 MAG-121220-bin83]NQW26116.1 hypothetical protein [Cryomorphaceae bacterium]HAB32223.1 hypothetical protein [Cryomorphaceae bacterium]|tara:strand:+ start:1124 stop:1411 length:288 start_codon:yes stop_codon:yes gene_type:complete
MKRIFLCTTCQTWHEGQHGHCPNCLNKDADALHNCAKQPEDHRTPNPFEMPLPTWIKDSTISAPLRFIKNTGVALQWVAMFFAGSIAWMAYWVAV